MLGLKSPSADLLRTGLVHSRPACAAVLVRRPASGSPQLVHAAFELHRTGEPGERVTQALLARLPKRRSPIAAVLDAADYQIIATEALNLPPAELREAVRWRIREQSSMPAENAVLDCFALPAARGSNTNLQVVVAAPASIDMLSSIASLAARELCTIDIQELALRNLMALLPQDRLGCAFVFLGRGAINILISCAGVLYVARRIDAGLRGGGVQLALEIQRSLQYYESQFDRAPIGEIVIGPDSADARNLAPEIASASGLQVQVLDLASIMQVEPDVAAIGEPELLLAIGAALRPADDAEAA